MRKTNEYIILILSLLLLASQLANAQILPEKVITRIDPGRVEQRVKPKAEIEIKAPRAKSKT
jgi:hypothetical protein